MAPAKEVTSDTVSLDGHAFSDRCIGDLFEEQATRNPAGIALIQGRRLLTYSQLSAQTGRLARFLRTSGVRPEKFVGVCLNNGIDAVVAVLGVLKAGGAYVPLDPGLPPDRLHHMAFDAGLSLCISNKALRNAVPSGISVVCLDLDAEKIQQESPDAPESFANPDNAAWVLYTSGSTGLPKGVVGTHRGITAGLVSVEYDTAEVCCLNASISFGLSLANMFLPLIRGISLVVLTDRDLKDIARFTDILEREKISRVVLLPTVLNRIIDLGPLYVAKLQNIRRIGLVGSELTPELVRRFTTALPYTRFHNVYSSTEIGTPATYWEVTPDTVTRGRVTLGKPVANTTIHIFDRDMKPVPKGESGEICVGAPHLARGYMGLPALTAERFVRDPFAFTPGQRLYRTGDLGRIGDDGNIEYLGRVDDQVKVRGFRIILAEVERALASHELVREAAVTTQGTLGEERLVAHFVPSGSPIPSPAELRAWLSDRLPDYMVPAAFSALAQLPLGDNGKLDRRALPEIVRATAEHEYGGHLSSALETSLEEIWGEVLGFHPIDADDHFLDVGGDSLLASAIATRIESRFQIDVSAENVFDQPTIRQLAKLILEKQATVPLNAVGALQGVILCE
ncbi:MAG TPA: non-ribosomal peptide synthetase [Bryobacteraceae bacterium]|jgi:amino acid adenylation domain-containing protein|nr:non-ribosomal peptide synthetase [Bryobacteraceae bacterium]